MQSDETMLEAEDVKPEVNASSAYRNEHYFAAPLPSQRAPYGQQQMQPMHREPPSQMRSEQFAQPMHRMQQQQQQQQHRYQSSSQNLPQSDLLIPEPSVNSVRDSISKPLTAAQQKILNERAQPCPGEDLHTFINTIDSFTPIIPDAVTQYFLNKSGVGDVDPRVVRLVAIATQKYIADILIDCMHSSRMKGLGQAKKGSKELKYSLTSDVLDVVLREYGINPSRAAFFQ